MKTRIGLIALSSAGLVPFAAAQEAMYTEAATMPSPGTGIVRPQFHFYRFGDDPQSAVDSFDEYQLMTGLQYGIARDWAVLFDVPIEWRREELESGGVKREAGVADLDAAVKWRFYRKDTGGIDTVRAALIAGAEIPSGSDTDTSSQSVNPHAGAVITLVKGRHGFNQDLHYQFNTGGDKIHNTGGNGTDDAVFHNSAYVFRFWPERYASDSVSAWYATAELLGIYETNGDYELRFAPGIMYEGRRWGAEAMITLPVYDQLDERAEMDFGFGFGLRFSF